MFNNDDKSNSKDELLQNTMPKMDISSVFVNLRSTGENDEFPLPFTAPQPPNFSDFESYLTGGNSALRAGANTANNPSFNNPAADWSAFTANNGSALYSAAADFGMGTASFVQPGGAMLADKIDINQANAILQNIPNFAMPFPSNENQIPKPNSKSAFESSLNAQNAFGGDFFANQKYAKGLCNGSVLQQIDFMVNFLSSNASASPYSNFDHSYLAQFMQVVISVMLNSNTSQQGVFKCVNLFYLLAKRSVTRNVLLKFDILPKLILEVLAKYNVVAVVRQCLSVIYYLSSNSQFLHSFISVTFEDMLSHAPDPQQLQGDIERSSFGIKTLCYCLSNYSKIDPIIFYSAATIHTVLLTFPKSREEFCANNCVLMLCQYLTKNNDKFLAIIVDCLCCLCMNNDAAQSVLVNSGFQAQLIRILESKTYEKLVYTACRLVKIFSSNNKFKKLFVQSNIMTVLTNLLLNNSKRLAITAMWSMKNFSEAAIHHPNLENLVVICLRFLGSQLTEFKARNNNFSIPSSANNDSETLHPSQLKDNSKNNSGATCLSNMGFPEPGLVVCSLGVLANLICNDHHKQLLLAEDGVNTVMQLASITAKIKELVEPCFSIFRHLTNGKNAYVAAKTTMILLEQNFHHFIVGMLDPIYQKNDFYPALKSIIIELCHNMCKVTFFINANEQKVDVKNFCCEYLITAGMLHKLQVLINFSTHIVKHLKGQAGEGGGSISPKTPQQLAHYKKNTGLYEKVIEEGLMVLFYTCSVCTYMSDQGRTVKAYFRDNSVIDTLISAGFTKNLNMLKCCVGILTFISNSDEGVEALRFYFANNNTGNEGPNPTGLLLLNHFNNCFSDACVVDDPLRSAVSNLIMKWSESLFALNIINNSNSSSLAAASGSSFIGNSHPLNLQAEAVNNLSRTGGSSLNMNFTNPQGEFFNNFLNEKSNSNFDSFDNAQNFR